MIRTFIETIVFQDLLKQFGSKELEMAIKDEILKSPDKEGLIKVLLYPKNIKENITDRTKKILKSQVEVIKNECKKKKKEVK